MAVQRQWTAAARMTAASRRLGATQTTMIAVVIAVGIAAVFVAARRLETTDAAVDRIVANTLVSRDGERALHQLQRRLRHAPPESISVQTSADGVSWLTFTMLDMASDGTPQYGVVDRSGRFYRDAQYRYGVLDGTLVWFIVSGGDVIGAPVDLLPSSAPAGQPGRADGVRFSVSKTTDACLIEVRPRAASRSLRAIVPLAPPMPRVRPPPAKSGEDAEPPNTL